jgi:hypothetical protein
LGTPWPAADRALDGGVRKLHARLGVAVNDPDSTWDLTDFQLIPGRIRHEDLSGNLLHALLLGMGGLVGSAGLLHKRDRPTLGLGLCVLAAFGLFCLLLRWQPWHSRLHLPLFVLAAPLAGMFLARWWRPAAVLAGIGLATWAIPFLLWNERRPLFGEGNILATPRQELYYRSRMPLLASQTRVAEVLRANRCVEVGALIEREGWEYPLWVLWARFRAAGVRLEHVGVQNVSARLAATHMPEFRPSAIVRTVWGEAEPELRLDGRLYRRAWADSMMAVYLYAGE